MQNLVMLGNDKISVLGLGLPCRGMDIVGSNEHPIIMYPAQ